MEKKHRILLIVLVVMLIAVVAYVIYKVFFQFDNATVASEVATAAGNDAASMIVIQDGINHILASTYLTQQVLDYATMSGIPKEQVLVNSAVADAKSKGYIMA